MKLTITSIAFTLLLVSAGINVGLITGYVRIGSPQSMQELAYSDSQRALMTALVEEAQ